MNTAFFEQFLVFTQVQTGVFIAILAALFALLAYLKKKDIFTLSGRLMLATFLGIGLGLGMLFVAGMPDDPLSVGWVEEVRAWYGLVATGFMTLLQMLVVPLVLVSIIRVIVNMEGGKSVSKLVSRGVGMLIGTTLIGAIIAIVFAQIFGLGAGAELVYGNEEVREITSVVTTLLGFIPNNPFDVFSRGAVIPTIIFASFVGFAVRGQVAKDAKVVQPFINFNEALYVIIMNIAQKIISLLPYAVIALLANTIASRGLEAFSKAALFVGIYILSAVVMFAVQLTTIALNGLNPIQHLKNVGKALILAFTSRSSLGTLPVSLETLKTNSGLSQGTATFVMSLGANGGMNGAGIYSGMISIMLANMVGYQVDATFILMLLFVIALSSFGIAGVPGGILLMISIPLTALGLGEHFALAATVFAIDPIVDMFRTFTNVSGALTASTVVAKSLDEVDMETFNQEVVSAVSSSVTAKA